MKRFALVVVPPILLVLTMLAQNDRGSLTGTLSDPDDGPVPTASVQLRHVTTGAVYSTTSAANGTYTLAGLPAGTYDLTIPPIGFTFDKLERKGIAVQAGETRQLDIRFEWGGNLGTPGDDFTFAVRTNSPAPSGPTPRTRDGKPDFSGVWIGLATSREEPSLLPWAEALTKERAANFGKDHPSASCLPGDPVLTSPFIYKIVQTPALIVILWEGNFPGHDQIFLDGRGHPEDLNPTWMGHSTGRWEGDTLVVDTVGFNDRSWLGLAPHTEMMHVVQRYRRPDLGHLEKDITIEDPGTFTKPWHFVATWDLAPGEEVQEMVCESNPTPQHMPGN